MREAAKHAVILTLFLAACGGERRADMASAGDTAASAQAAAPAADTARPADTSPADTTPAATQSPPETASAPKPAAKPAPKPTPKPASKKPPAPAPAAAAESTPPATQPAAQQPAPSAAPNAGSPADQGAPLRDAYHQAPRDTVSQIVYDGWKQYNLNCARCHGEDVLGTTIAPHLILSLKPDGPINTKELFVQTVCAGRPAKGMPAWCALGLGMDKINEIYEYVHGRSAGKIAPGRPAVKQAG